MATISKIRLEADVHAIITDQVQLIHARGIRNGAERHGRRHVLARERSAVARGAPLLAVYLVICNEFDPFMAPTASQSDLSSPSVSPVSSVYCSHPSIYSWLQTYVIIGSHIYLLSPRGQTIIMAPCVRGFTLCRRQRSEEGGIPSRRRP